MTRRILILAPADNVGIATGDLRETDRVSVVGTLLAIATPVPRGHKVALRPIRRGEAVRKYGAVIGRATADIRAGEWVHTHNLADGACVEPEGQAIGPPGDACRDRSPAKESGGVARWRGATFEGYRRPDGRVGTRNYIAVLSSVNCSGTVSRLVAERFPPERLAPYANIDGVVALTHGSGCGMPRHGHQRRVLDRVFQGILRHPNVARCLCIGLGCEQVPSPEVVALADPASSPPDDSVLVIQEVGGTRKTVELAERIVASWLEPVGAIRREPVPVDRLVVATECGGSDAFSGVTANRVVGAAVDRLGAAGAACVFSETPELFGAEASVLERMADPRDADRLRKQMAWWRWYTGVFETSPAANPSPGNQKGGLTTIAEKSLGAVQKSGRRPIEGVLDYAEPIQPGKLQFMDSPGYDPVSVVGMVAGGATIVWFTTGRGSCFGAPLAPTIKIATTSELVHRMPDDLDFDAGLVLAGTPVPALADTLIEQTLRVASGHRTASERLGYGAIEFEPWAIGPVL